MQLAEESNPRRRWPELLLGALVLLALAAVVWWRFGHVIYTDDQGIRASGGSISVREITWSPASPIDPALSSVEDEYEPCLSADGGELYFVRGKAGGNADIHVSYRRNNRWTSPLPLLAINSDADDLGPRLTRDGRYLLFYSDRAGGFGTYDLWISQRQDGGWSEPQNLGPQVNTPFNEISPAPSPDGARIYFASDRPGLPRIPGGPRSVRPENARDYDLYAAELAMPLDEQDIASGPPAFKPMPQLLAAVNTRAHESGCAVAPVGAFLYFASDRDEGFGRFDIYRSRILPGGLAAPENLGENVNSAASQTDPMIAAGGFTLYFSNDIGDGMGLELLRSDSREVYALHEPHALPAVGWRFWTTIIALAAFVPLFTILRTVGGRRVSLLTKSLLISLLLHIVLTASFSIVRLSQHIVIAGRKEAPAETSVNLDAAQAFEVSTQIRQAMTNVTEQVPALREAPKVPVPVVGSRPDAPNVEVKTPQATPQAQRVADPSMTPSRPTPIDERPDSVRPDFVAARTTVAPAAQRPPKQPESSPQVSPAAVGSPPAAPVDIQTATNAPQYSGQVAPAAPTAESMARPAATPVAAAQADLPTVEIKAQPSAAPARMTIAVSTGRLPAEQPQAVAVAPAAPAGTISQPQVAAPATSRPTELALSVPGSTADARPMAIDLPPAAPVAIAPIRIDPVSVGLPAIAPAASAGVGGVTVPAVAPPVAVPEQRPGVVAVAPPAVEHHLAPPVAPAGLPDPQRYTAPPPVLPPAPASLVDVPLAPTASPGAGDLPVAPVDPRTDLAALPSGVVPGSAISPESLLQRSADIRQKLVDRNGGTPESEAAVGRSLAFLARVQARDGHWTYIGSDEAVKINRDQHDIALTGLATLCFLASDHTSAKDGPYREHVARAVNYLMARQKPDGDLRGKGDMYDHGIATIALAESAIMTGRDDYRTAAAKAMGFIEAAQNTRTGGWRYLPGEEGDTSVFGWQVMALRSASKLKVTLKPETLERAAGWIETVGSRTDPILAGYQPRRLPNAAMTAEAAYCRLLLGQKITLGQLRTLGGFLLEDLPGQTDDLDYYAWYYTSLTLMNFQDQTWQKWNTATRDHLIKRQSRDPRWAGSWAPDDKWAATGGRVYSTAFATLTLEVYYRYLPLYTATDE